MQNIGSECEHEHKKWFWIWYDMSTTKHAIVKLLIEHWLNVAFNKCYMWLCDLKGNESVEEKLMFILQVL